MTIAKDIADSAAAAVADVRDGATLLIGGFGDVGVPFELLAAVAASDARELTVVANNCGTGNHGLALLFAQRKIAKAIASFPLQPNADHFLRAYREGSVELELVPQGTLVARLSAAATGLAAVYSPVGVDTDLASGKEIREFDGRPYLLETALRGDVALVHADCADRAGNLRFRRAARNFNPLMAKAARTTIVEARHIVEAGDIDPDDVHLAGVYVHRIVMAAR